MMHYDLTDKQYKIMVVICEGEGKDVGGKLIPVDMDRLLERLAYRTNKSSMQFSIRALIKHGFIVKDYDKRRGAKRVVYVPTKAGMSAAGYAPPASNSYVQPDIEGFLARA
ncbi:hypothetical protein [Methylobacillus sp.]|uniref:hypothetical protein n=1 Tax=Methylobacillus sp. TaxID=56818 RepID=UPI0012C875E1|nr:hypothetical protein [Methylobacillus sp.]MPS48539.1 hypothetical protein [Methylobacillus sp.]